jgi:hypothetical protein
LVAESVLAFSTSIVVRRILGAHVDIHFAERTCGLASFGSNLGGSCCLWRLGWSFVHLGL